VLESQESAETNLEAEEVKDADPQVRTQAAFTPRGEGGQGNHDGTGESPPEETRSSPEVSPSAVHVGQIENAHAGAHEEAEEPTVRFASPGEVVLRPLPSIPDEAQVEQASVEPFSVILIINAACNRRDQP